MTKLREKVWLWGQTEGSHHINKNFRVPGRNRMTALEGAVYFGIPNMCRVVMAGLPNPPFDQEAMVLDRLKNVIWSIIGDGSSGQAVYIDEIIRLAEKYTNISGVIMDDFFTETRMEIFTPAYLREIKAELCEKAPRPLPLWGVIYTQELTEERRAHLAECDKISMWTWWSDYLPQMEENYEKLRQLWDGKEIYAGCYMWDYGNGKEIPDDLMQLQLDTYYKWLREGKIAGMILCSNCCADVGLKAADMARKWMDEHGDEEI